MASIWTKLSAILFYINDKYISRSCCLRSVSPTPRICIADSSDLLCQLLDPFDFWFFFLYRDEIWRRSSVYYWTVIQFSSWLLLVWWYRFPFLCPDLVWEFLSSFNSRILFVTFNDFLSLISQLLSFNLLPQFVRSVFSSTFEDALSPDLYNK